MGFALPLVSIGGRGDVRPMITLPVETRWIVNQVVYGDGTEILYPEASGTRVSFVGYSPGYLESRLGTDRTFCGSSTYDAFTLLRLHWISPDGADQELIDTNSYGEKKPTGLTCVSGSVYGPASPFDRGRTFVSTDGSTMTFRSDNPLKDDQSGSVSGILMMKDGTRYQVDGGRVKWMSDRNGNLIQFYSQRSFFEPWSQTTQTVSDPWGRPVRITDPLKRETIIEYREGSAHPSEDWIRFPGTVERTVKIQYAKLNELLRDTGDSVKPIRDLFRGAAYPPPQDNVNSIVHNPDMVSAVVLPNGQSYRFKYNSYGELAWVWLPSGGRTEYDWQSRTIDPDGIYGSLMVYRRLTERRVYMDAVTTVPLRRTTYDAPLLTTPGDLVVTVYEKDAGGAVHRKTSAAYHGTPLTSAAIAALGYPGWREGKQRVEQVQTGSGATLQQIDHVWRNRDRTTHASIAPQDSAPPSDARIVETLRTLGTLVSKTTFAYSADEHNNVNERCEYDFGAAVRKRCTNIAYETGAGYTSEPVHLRGLPKSEIVGTYAGSTFTREAETQYVYDEYGSGNVQLTDRTGISEQDPSRRQPFTLRGNATTVARWNNNPDAAADPWARTNYEYDIAGNVTALRWPKVQTEGGLVTPVTNANYNDDYTGSVPAEPTFAFPTSITHPGGFTTSAKYHYKLGRISEFTHVNGKKTTYGYGNNDALDRLTSVVHPIGSTEFVYAASPIKITTTKSLEAGRYVVTETEFDGLGRPWRNVRRDTYGGAASAVTTDTEYDALGRVSGASNPKRGAPDKWTRTTFDALDRPLDVTLPDGAVSRTRYSNNTIVTRDPANRWRKVVKDALGRIIELIEDPVATIDNFSNNGQNLSTLYTYDARDNLLAVAQGGRDRSFEYDSLGRLQTAKSPETGPSVSEGDGQDQNGIISYQYDPAGNLIQRTDALQAVTTLRYDAAGRVRKKSYSGVATPEATWCYNGSTAEAGCAQAPPNVAANLLTGQLTMVSTAEATTKFTQYDELGRVRKSSQTISGLANALDFEYTWNDVAMKSVKFPSGRTVSYTYDDGGRISALSGQSGAEAKTYVTQAEYAAHGAIELGRRQKLADGCDSRLRAGRAAGGVLGHDWAIAVLHGRAAPQAQGATERRCAQHCFDGQGPGQRPSGHAADRSRLVSVQRHPL